MCTKLSLNLSAVPCKEGYTCAAKHGNIFKKNVQPVSANASEEESRALFQNLEI